MIRFYVYELIDPRSDIVFYVGMGRGSRMYDHVTESKRSRHKWTNIIKCQRINSILRDGYDVKYNKCLIGVSRSRAVKKEQQLIDRYGLIVDGSGILTNVRRSKQHHGDLPLRRPTKRVYQYTLTGNLVNVYESVTEAADCLQKHKTNILNVCNGKRFTAYGFVWHYEEDEFSPPPCEIEYHVKRRRPVACFDDENTVIQTYQSIKEATNDRNVKGHGIIRSCKSNGKLRCGGVRWRYRDTAN